MINRKQLNFQSPDLSQLQVVVIDHKTTIFIAMGADPDKAKRKYREQMNSKYVRH
ncbi:MAG: hypothetical protein KQH79_11290 [Bacteroidetes bacterium]|nr:hypothetical protein [Bacteroidota bacterium]